MLQQIKENVINYHDSVYSVINGKHYQILQLQKNFYRVWKCEETNQLERAGRKKRSKNNVYM